MKISCTSTPSPTNQPSNDPFHLYSLSPHSPQFQQSAGDTPLSGLSGGNRGEEMLEERREQKRTKVGDRREGKERRQEERETRGYCKERRDLGLETKKGRRGTRN
jgi:hypothetical protein